MEQTKKRHNPPIYDEDLAVKSFDRLDDIVQKADTSKVEVVKTDDALKEELASLAVKVFGDFFLGHREGKNSLEILLRVNNENYSLLKSEIFAETKLIVYKSKKANWYKRATINKYFTLEVDRPEQLIKSDAIEITEPNSIIQKGRYQPIKITAHTSEALKQAKLFAAAYQELTKQKARVIQDCADEETVNQTKVKTAEKIEAPIVEVVPKEPSKNAKVLREMSRGVWKGTKWSLTNIIAAPFIVPTRIRRNYQSNDVLMERDGFLSTVHSLFWPPTNIIAHTSLTLSSVFAAQNGHWEVPAIYLGANAVSGIYEFYRHSKNKVEEEERWKR